MKVITFSKTYPSYHLKNGERTNFVEKIWASLVDQQLHLPEFWEGWHNLNIKYDFDVNNFDDIIPKCHTLRAGERWKAGEWFSPRIWSGKPYNSKQVEFAPAIEIKKVWDIKFQLISRPFYTHKNEKGYHVSYTEGTGKHIAINDGFENVEDLEGWLLGGTPIHNPVFEGQIICWNEKINYF